MNSVNLIGRLTKDPEVRYGATNQMAIANFNLAVERPVKQNGEKQVDFPRITVFGKQAENVEKYVVKGMLVGIIGRIQTGSYQNKDGTTVYTTDVIADRVEFLEWRDKNGNNGQQMQQANMGYQLPMGYGYQQPQGGMYPQGQMQGMYPQQQQMNYGQQPMQAPTQQTAQQSLFGQNQQKPAPHQQMQMAQNQQQAPVHSMPQQNVQQAPAQPPLQEEMPGDFAAIDEDVPF